MKNKDKAELAKVFNDLTILQRDFPNLSLGGAARIKNSIYTLGKYLKDVPEKNGLKDYEFIYKHDK
jgi:hypothetical protein